MGDGGVSIPPWSARLHCFRVGFRVLEQASQNSRHIDSKSDRMESEVRLGGLQCGTTIGARLHPGVWTRCCVFGENFVGIRGVGGGIDGFAEHGQVGKQEWERVAVTVRK